MAKRERSLFGLGMLVAAGWAFFWVRRLLREPEETPGRDTPPGTTSAAEATQTSLQKSPAPLPSAAGREEPVADLTEISGIGPTYARRLRAAGIRTFSDLAALTPDEALQAAKAQPWQADPAGWIAQAEAKSNP